MRHTETKLKRLATIRMLPLIILISTVTEVEEEAEGEVLMEATKMDQVSRQLGDPEGMPRRTWRQKTSEHILLKPFSLPNPNIY